MTREEAEEVNILAQCSSLTQLRLCMYLKPSISIITLLEMAGLPVLFGNEATATYTVNQPFLFREASDQTYLTAQS